MQDSACHPAVAPIKPLHDGADSLRLLKLQPVGHSMIAIYHLSIMGYKHTLKFDMFHGTICILYHAQVSEQHVTLNPKNAIL